MKRYFELWLDESGKFDNDAKEKRKGWNPSLIGGVLIEKDSFGKTAIESIIPDKKNEFSHATSECKQETFDKFQKIEKKAQEIEGNGKLFRYVVFSNDECIMVLDNNITYQNIMAEGIVKLICLLKANFGDIQLNVLIANRLVDNSEDTKEKTTVKKDEYELRLIEKLKMSGIHNDVKENEWKLELASARKDKRLMIADNVCNCFLTRNTKFKGEQGEQITSIYDDKDKTIRFSVLQTSLEKQFYDLMLEKRLGEAVTVICQCDKQDIIDRGMDSVKQRIKKIGGEELELQYNFIKSLLDYYINITHSYSQCEKVLKNVCQNFIPIIDEGEHKEMAKKMSFDLNFYLLTLYTHMGNVRDTLSLEQICDEAFRKLPLEWNIIELGIKYDIRKVINRINFFDFEGAMELNEKVIERCRNIKDLLSFDYEEAKYNELAKALGTQVQIYTFLLRFKKEYYKKATEASNEAINEFVAQSNKLRQYIYRVHLEIEAEKYDTAYKYLCRACNVEEDGLPNKFREWLIEKENAYVLYAYVKLMAEAKAARWEMADELYGILQKTNVINELLNLKEINHPQEIILWKYAMYLVRNKELKAAFETYKSAIEYCFQSKELTINIIGLAIELERYAMALKNEMKEKLQYRKSLQNKYKNLYKKELPDSMRKVFGEIDFEEKKWEYYYNLSRRITY